MVSRSTSTYVLLPLAAIVATVVTLALVVRNDTGNLSGREVPKALDGDASQKTVLAWVISQNAYASCRRPTYALRRIQHRYGNVVSLVVWYQGHDEEDVQHILTRERLSASVQPLDSGVYKKWLGHGPKPALHLIKSGRLVESWMYTRDSIQAEEIIPLL